MPVISDNGSVPRSLSHQAKLNLIHIYSKVGLLPNHPLFQNWGGNLIHIYSKVGILPNYQLFKNWGGKINLSGLTSFLTEKDDIHTSCRTGNNVL